ncbi:MAG: PEGA domain-containing protein [Polyangiaceae bacterium]
MNVFRRVLCPCVAVLVSLSSMAYADAPGNEDALAAELKEQGNAEMNALNYERALEKFDEGLTHAKSVILRASLIYNKGRTFQAMGNFPAALEALEAFDKVAPQDLRAKVGDFDALLEDLRGRVATLSLECSVVGAEIFVDDRRLDTCRAGSTLLRVRAGKTRVEVRKEGYLPFSVEVDLRARQSNVVRAVLTARASQGVLRIESAPGVLARLDGKVVGVVPWEGSVLSGEHDIQLSKDGFEPTRRSVLVLEGQRHLIKVDTLATPPFTKTGAFWGLVGGGVAIVGGAILGIVVASNTEKTPGSGTLAPGRIYTGGVRF